MSTPGFQYSYTLWLEDDGVEVPIDNTILNLTFNQYLSLSSSRRGVGSNNSAGFSQLRQQAFSATPPSQNVSSPSVASPSTHSATPASIMPSYGQHPNNLHIGQEFYRALIKNVRRVSGRSKLRCCELFTLYLGQVPTRTIASHNSALVKLLN